jgi:hypothetical protein
MAEIYFDMDGVLADYFGGLKDTDTTNADAADGDIILTTVGAIANATYDITIEVAY